MEPAVYWLGLVTLGIGPLLVSAAARSRGVRLGLPAYLMYAFASGLFLAESAENMHEQSAYPLLLATLVLVPVLVAGAARLRGFDGGWPLGLGTCAACAIFVASVGIVAVAYDGYIEDTGSPPTRSLAIGIAALAVAAALLLALAVMLLRGPER